MTRATVTILDVGHGSCVLLTSNDEMAIIDTGAGATLLEHLRSLERREVQRVLVSHADRDHVGGLMGLLASRVFTVGEILLNADAFKGSRLWVDLVYELDAWQSRPHARLQIGVRAGDSFTAGLFDIQILAPRARLVGLGPGGHDQNGRRIESNTLSVVARVTVGGEPVALLPGDLDELGLEHLLDQTPPPDLRAPILVFPHHGGHVSRAGTVDANVQFATRLAELVMPSTVVFSIGRGQHDTPRQEIVAALRSTLPEVNILCTELSRHCAAAVPPGGTAGAHLLATTARGRAADSCCAGSIIIDVGEGHSRLQPSLASHRAFIEAHALTALCRSPLAHPSQGAS